MIRDRDRAALDRLLRRLETGFRVALAVLLAVLLLGQALLLTEEGRSRLSRADRLEGTRLPVATEF